MTVEANVGELIRQRRNARCDELPKAALGADLEGVIHLYRKDLVPLSRPVLKLRVGGRSQHRTKKLGSLTPFYFGDRFRRSNGDDLAAGSTSVGT